MVFLVFADAFDEFGVCKQIEWNLHRPGLRVSLWVIERKLHIQMPEIRTAEPLGDAKRLRVRMARIVEPTLVVEANRLGNEGITVPMADRIAEPGGSRIW